MANYLLEGPKWGSGTAGTSGGTVTWAVDGSVPSYFMDSIKAAFADWSGHADINFQQVASPASAEIDFSDNYIDGLGNVLGVTNYNYSGQNFSSAAINFDSGEGWHNSGNNVVSSDGEQLFVVALHEIGHAIGLDHYNDAPAVMNAYLSPAITDLTASDVSGIQALYGAPPQAPDTVYSGASCTLPAGAHNLILTGTAQYGIGNDLDNVLIGNDLPNTLVGGPGADTMAGGKGDDIYGVDSPGDYVVERPGEGFDTVYASVNYTLTDNVEALILTGGATAGTGNGSDNVLIGNSLDNTLIGGAGNDLMAGGAGNDIYGVDSVGDYVVENANAGFDTVYSSVNYTLTANVEALILTGTAQDAIGNELDNVLIGNSADNRILGGAGNDTMAGGGGSDTFLFAPGFGHDQITDFTAGSGAGHDVLAFDHTIFHDMTDVLAHSHQSGSNVVIEANANDTITLQNVTLANLTASDFHFL